MSRAKSNALPRDERFHLRATARQGALIRAAAGAADKNVTEFVLEAATAAAEKELADRRWFVVDPEEYDRFLALLDRPERDVPGLSDLFSRPRPMGMDA